MPETLAPPPLPDTEPPKKKRHGCFFYGCLIFSLLVILAFGFAAAGLYFGYRHIKTSALEYADPAPAPMLVSDLPPEQLEALQARISRFEADSQNGLPTPPLTLSAPEINALIQHDPHFSQAKDHLQIDLSADQLQATVSIPLSFIGQEGHYFNGIAAIRLAQGPKGPQLYLEHLEVHGKAMTGVVMDQIRSIDLFQEARLRGQNQEFFRLMDRVQIEGGKLIIFARSSTSL